ncbi:MAG: phosphotransferase family protein [Moraxellaceae bacterium]|nr:MAG: phosphotransferase family protein [Moraxellaceae bacterium]
MVIKNDATDSAPFPSPNSLAKLNRYLSKRIDGFGSILSAEKFSDGQSNPTYLLTTDCSKYVLRRKPEGPVLPSAHAVDREFRVMSALASTPVPVPVMHILCEDKSIIGSVFFIMEYVQGTLHWDAQLTGVGDPKSRGLVYRQMNKVLADLHGVDISAVGLEGFGRPGGYCQRQYNRWSKQYRASETESIEAMELLMQWLPNHMPEDDGRVSLIHGDYRLDNIIFAENEPKIIAVLDWELSTLGHPFSDLAYQCMQLRMPADLALGNLSGLGGIDREAIGVPSEEEYVALYCKRRGLQEIPHWPFYLAFNFFRFAAILQGIMKRYQDGSASNDEALSYGKMARPTAELAVAYLRSENLLPEKSPLESVNQSKSSREKPTKSKSETVSG